MFPLRLVTCAAFSTAVVTAAVAQGIPRNARPTSATTAAPRLMVANPFAFASADSAAAVAIGTSMREEMKGTVGRDYLVIERAQMNDALKQYGYPVDAILSEALAVTLAKNIQARFVVTSTMAKGDGGRYAVTVRIRGVSDDAGNVISLTQNAGENPEAFGKRLVDALEPAVKSMADSKACIDQRKAKPDKAVEAANKAVKQVPNNGLAEYCLALIAGDKKQSRGEVVKHLQASTKGDPQSLPVWTALAGQYQAANDTANTLVAFKQMLRVAPTNQKLREELFKYFLQSGHPETAKEVADEGLKIDPYNADLYDLKSNACLFLSDFKCAVDALETMYATDSTKADTLFFTKISAAAAEGEKPDTVRLLKWSQVGTRKYPDNPTLISYALRGYAMTCQTDSVISVTSRIIQKDTSAVPQALAAAKALISPDSSCAKKMAPAPVADTSQKPTTGTDSGATAVPTNRRPKEAMPFIDFAIAHGDPQQKENAAALLYQGGASLLQAPQDLAGAAEMLRKAVTTANPAGKVAPAANYLRGLATLFQVPQIDPQAEKGKSCDLAKQEEALLTESETALTAGQSVNPDAVKKNLDIIKKYKPRIASMLKAYCK